MRLALGVMLLCFGVAHAEPPNHPHPKVASPPLASLERTTCFGSCPAYKVVVWPDGKVEWTGNVFVQVKGKATKQVTPADLDAIRAAFTAADYFALNENYACYEVTDHPTATTSFNDGTHDKTIVHYHGCRSKKGVQALTKLEDRLDEILKTSEWIGDGPERGRR